VIFVQRFLLGFIFSFPSLAFGSVTAAPAPVFGGLVQVILALVLVIAAIAGSAWLMRRFGPTRMGPGSAMRVLGGVMIGQRERLVLVEVGETWLIVGVAPGQVAAVHTMPRPLHAEQAAQSFANQPSFGDWLKEAWRKRGGT
jgi:flagellar protein FliO/FliZ